MEQTKNKQDYFHEQLEKEYQKLQDDIQKPNILLLGGTGVGKSSLVNLIFNANIAQSGVGKPVTKEIHRYEIDDIPVVLYDSVGYELESEAAQQEFIAKVGSFVTASKEKTVAEQIHLVWYHIQASGHRVTQWDQQLLSQIKELNIPIAVVFTKCDLISDEEISTLKNEVTNYPTFEVTNNPTIVPKYLELSQLIEWSTYNLDEGLKEAFIKAQKVNLEVKKVRASNVINQHIAGNAVVGFTPIPFSDAPLLLASQAAMFARLIFIYDLDSMSNLLPTLLKAGTVGTAISTGGRWLAGNLLKMIPGVGTVVGGIITGSVAGVLTAAMGYAVSEICYTISKLALDGEDSKVQDYITNIKPVFENLISTYYKKHI